jgi:hypothetical protein
LTTDHPSLADQLKGTGASRNANLSRSLATTPLRRSSVSPVRAAGGISRRWWSASWPWRWSWNRLPPCASSNFRNMLIFSYCFRDGFFGGGFGGYFAGYGYCGYRYYRYLSYGYCLAY